MVRMPVNSSTAEYRKVDAQTAAQEGFRIGTEYFEPIDEYFFVFTEKESEAIELVNKHLQKWS